MRMSPQFMKDFLQIIKGNLDEFEKNYGEIKVSLKKQG